MLIDELLAAPTIDNVLEPYRNKICQRLKAAQRFEIAPDFAAAADALSVDFNACANAIPFCRLPFKSMWIEVAQQTRPRFASSDIHLPGMQHIPKRVGFLLDVLDKNHKTFKAHQFWSFPDRDTKVMSELGMEFHPENMKEDHSAAYSDDGLVIKYVRIDSSEMWKKSSIKTRSVLISVIRPCPNDYPTSSVAYLRDDELEMALEIATVDWSGESMFLLATLALLNTVNAHERVEGPDLSMLNKARSRRGARELLSYHVLKISPRLKAKLRALIKSTGESDMPAHFVRGHFKARKTGIFFWHPFWRGKSSVGVVEKDYVLT